MTVTPEPEPEPASESFRGRPRVSGRDPEAVSRFVERFARQLVDAGLPRIAARIFAAILATDTSRLTAAELSAQLRASPAAISGGVRYLIQVGRKAGMPARPLA
jgi:hypothetical protein